MLVCYIMRRKWSHARDLRPALPITNQLHRCLCLHGRRPSPRRDSHPHFSDFKSDASTVGLHGEKERTTGAWGCAGETAGDSPSGRYSRERERQRGGQPGSVDGASRATLRAVLRTVCLTSFGCPVHLPELVSTQGFAP